MGMFDYVRCEYPLPVERKGGALFQTKDTPAQYMDEYVIAEDGALLHVEYDVEDRSDPNAEGIFRIAGMMTRVNKRRVPLPDYTGEICFYGFDDERSDKGWIEYSAYFKDGRLQQLNLIDHDAAA